MGGGIWDFFCILKLNIIEVFELFLPIFVQNKNSPSEISLCFRRPLRPTIITGFLGSGKTTFLNHLLSRVVRDFMKKIHFQPSCFWCRSSPSLPTRVGERNHLPNYLIIQSKQFWFYTRLLIHYLDSLFDPTKIKFGNTNDGFTGLKPQPTTIRSMWHHGWHYVGGKNVRIGYIGGNLVKYFREKNITVVT